MIVVPLISLDLLLTTAVSLHRKTFCSVNRCASVAVPPPDLVISVSKARVVWGKIKLLINGVYLLNLTLSTLKSLDCASDWSPTKYPKYVLFAASNKCVLLAEVLSLRYNFWSD